MKTYTKVCLSLFLPLAVFMSGNLVAQTTEGLFSASGNINLLSNGGFEADNPAYWTAEGAGAEWSDEQYRTPSYSLKLSGSGESSWKQAEAVRNWVPGIPAGGTPEIIVGGWVYVDGVNTNPASDAEKFQLVYEFFDANGTDVLGAPVVLDVPQTEASSGWVEINSTSLGAITLPTEQAAKSVRITFRKGASATGTVYLEDIFLRAAEGAEGWAGDWFNPNMDMSDTWYYYTPDNSAGKADWPESLAFAMTRTDAQAHSGTYSTRIEKLDPTAGESVAISDRVPVTVGEPMLVSYWVKYEDVPNSDSIGIGDNNIGMTALWYSNLESGAAGYNELGGLDIRLNGEYNDHVIPLATRVENSGWTQYSFVVYPMDDAVGMEIRLRYWHAFEGVTYWDDIFIAPVSTVTDNLDDLLSNGGFEADNPAYWTAEGAGAEWSDEQYRTPSYSLKLSGSGESSWKQAEAVRNWVPGIPAGGTPEIIVGGWVYVDGVNTNPASDAEKFQLVYEFFDANGTDVLGAPVVLDVPQTEASSGWVEINSTSLGAITLPTEQAAKSVRITFRKGASATGTVYLEDIFLRAAEGAEGWAGDWFNPNMDMSDTWYYYTPDNSAGKADWPESLAFAMTRTDAQAHSGTYSTRIEKLDPTAGESVAISDRVPVTVGEPMLVSYWVKYEDVPNSDSIGIGDNNIGMTALWYSNLESGAAGYNELGGLDIRLNGEYNDHVIPLATRVENSGWTQYAFVVYPIEGAVGMEIRLRYWHSFEGATYWDDVSITNLSDVPVDNVVSNEEEFEQERPTGIHLNQNYPNPFNPTTVLSFELSQTDVVSLSVFNMLGQKVMDLITNTKMSSGLHSFTFDAQDLPSGIYLYRLSTSKFTEVKRMTLIK
mgnify:CR=1 FL=1